MKDGVLLLKLLNSSVPDAVDERVINRRPVNAFQWTENNNLLINSAKAVGLHIVNIGSQDLIEGRPHLILGLVWQIIKRGLLAKVNLQLHPELYRLLRPGETLDDFLALTAEEILVRWVNYHLHAAGHSTEIANLSSDIRDSTAYTVLLHQLAPERCSRSPLKLNDLAERAEHMLQQADRLGCRKYVTAKTVVSANPRLNLAFVANLFNQHPGLAPLEPADKQVIDDGLFGGEGSREARAFALWMNSLGVEPFVRDLFKDLRDGLILLHVIDRVHPDTVKWTTRVNTNPGLSRFRCIENTNYVVELGLRDLHFSLVGIQGADLTDGNSKLTLGLVWQLMREHVLRTLGPHSNEDDILAWANRTVCATTASAAPPQLTSFKDAHLADSHFLAALLDAIQAGCIDRSTLSPPLSATEALLSNAKYVINVARKLGAAIFLLPEDIVECKPKMLMTLIGTLMALSRQQHPK